MKSGLLNALILGVILGWGPITMAQSTSAVALATAQRSPASTTKTTHDSTATKGTPTALTLKTRCLDSGLLRINSAYVFQVVEPMTIGDRAFAAGDVVHAHVEGIDGVSGRVFLRTDRVVNGKTQQTTPLSMVATEQPHRPGVGIPHLLDGWKLDWESR